MSCRAVAAVVVIAVVACSSAPPPAERPGSPSIADAALPDAGLPAAVTSAPAWVFRYHTAQRSETWTLRHAEGTALLVVETAQGSTRYVGTVTEGASLALDVSTGTARLALECKPARRPVGSKCNDSTAAPIELLDCYHPDFAAPMPFGPAPGVEYVVDESCNGYRLVAQ